MTTIPSRLKIGGLIHAVRVVDSGLMTDEDSLGECDWVEQRISILDALPQRKRRNVLVHEIFEALTGTHIVEVQHEALSVLATELLRVLDDNPRLGGYLWPRG